MPTRREPIVVARRRPPTLYPATTTSAVVVSGDLTQSLGAPLERGQVMLELAPLDAYRVTLQVDERDIALTERARRIG